MTTLDLGPATSTLADLVTSVGDEQLALPTPCTEYAVGDLVEHVGGLAVAFTGAARKQPVPGSEQGGTGDASRLEPGWRERIAADLAELAEAWREPAAYEGMTAAGGVDLPGEVGAAVALNEVVVHGWDLATALGRPYAVADADARRACRSPGSSRPPRRPVSGAPPSARCCPSRPARRRSSSCSRCWVAAPDRDCRAAAVSAGRRPPRPAC